MKHHYIAVIVGLVLGYAMYSWFKTFPVFSTIDTTLGGMGSNNA